MLGMYTGDFMANVSIEKQINFPNYQMQIFHPTNLIHYCYVNLNDYVKKTKSSWLVTQTPQQKKR